MKKICLFLATLLVMMHTNAFAAELPSIAVSSEDAVAGDTVDITVSLANNPGIISLLLNVDYDDTAVTLVNVKDAGVFGNPLHADSLSVKPYVLFWSNGTAESDYMVNDVIATLTFEILKDTKPGDYPIEISYDKDNDGIFNFNLEAVDFGIVNGAIKVKETEKVEKIDKGTETKENDNVADDKKSNDKEATENNNEVAPNEVSVKINGNVLIFPDQKPIIKNDRTLVPLRAIFEALGATVDWDNDTRTVTSVRGDIKISLAIDSDRLYVNGNEKNIDVPAQIINDRTMVPIRAIAESFDCKVDWEQNTKTVIITY